MQKLGVLYREGTISVGGEKDVCVVGSGGDESGRWAGARSGRV